MKKAIKIIGTILVAILLLIIILPFAFQGKIEDIIKKEGNKMLNAQFDFAALDISLIKNFPSASVTLEDFWLKGNGEFENDTLIKAGELTATINIMSLFGDSAYDISKINIEDTHIKAIILKDGHSNWNIMKQSSESTPENEKDTGKDTGKDTEDVSEEQSAFRIKLQKLKIDNVSLIYDDRQADMFADIRNFYAECSGDFGSKHTTLNLEMETPSVSYRMGSIPFLNKVKIKADMGIEADFINKKFTLKDNSISLNAIEAGIQGYIAIKETDDIDMDIKLNTNKVGFKEILSLIPAIYTKDFKDLKTEGDVELSAIAKGQMCGDSIIPQMELSIDIKNAMFRYPSLPDAVNNINISAMIHNPGGDIDATSITVSPFNFVLAGNPFSMKASVKTPVSDPDFHITANGKLDLSKIKDVYPLENMRFNGIINADMDIQGRLSYIDNEQFEKVKAEGSIQLNDMNLTMKDLPAIDIKRSTFKFSPRYLELSETRLNIGNNDITFDSRFENYLAFIFKGSTLKGRLNVNSNNFNLNDFISEDTSSTSTESAIVNTSDSTSQSISGIIKVPDNIDFYMNANMKKVIFDKMTLNNINGLLLIKNGKIDMSNLSFNTMGGNVIMNGYYDTSNESKPIFDAGFKLQDIDFRQAYTELDMIQQLAPIFEGLKGNFSGNIAINAQLDQNMSPILNYVNGEGNLSTKDISLSDIKFINIVADIIKKPSMKDIKAKDLNIGFKISDGRVITEPFNIKLGEYTMKLSGSTGLDQSIDYKGTITMPGSSNSSRLGTVDMSIKGTFSSPKVGIDLKSMAKQASEQAIKSLGDKIISKKDTAEKNNVLDKAIDIFKKKKK